MITGDNKLTAEAIAMKLGHGCSSKAIRCILTSTENMGRKSFTGKDFEDMSEEQRTKVGHGNGV
eukprot:5585195-Amphidinium_carterae.1